MPQLRSDDTTHALLRQLVEQMKSSEARFSAFVESSEARFSAFVESSDARFSELNDKLNQLNSLAKSVDRNSQRIAELEQQCAALTNEVRGLKSELQSELKSELKSVLKSELKSELESDLKNDLCGPHLVPQPSASRVLGTSDIIISGIPGSLTDTSEQLVSNVFRALGTPQLVSDVLETRGVGGSGVSAGSAMRGAAPSTVSVSDRAITAVRQRSIIVRLKSQQIRDYILSAMRRKRRLTVFDVFSQDLPGQIYINELLPTDIYKLLRRTRVKARQLSFKHVWCTNGTIFVRKAHGQPPILIASEADLAGLQ